MKYEEYQVRVCENGTVEWFQNCQKHRIDGPAVKFSDGSEEWWYRGKLHRLDGPAANHVDGNKFWYIHGKPHRLDGPAEEYADGTKAWWIEGKHYSEKEFLNKTKSCDGKIVDIDGKQYRLTLVDYNKDYDL